MRWPGGVRAALSFDDTPLPEARKTVDALRALGLQVMLLSGDHAGAAARVAAMVGTDDWQAGLLPEAKRAALDQYRARHGAVAMVGDGLNDGPGLAWADVGIAWARPPIWRARPPIWCCRRTDLAWLPWVIGRGACRCVPPIPSPTWHGRFGYNLVALTCAVLGLLQPILAAAVMAGSSLLVVTELRYAWNACRAMSSQRAESSRGRAPGKRAPGPDSARSKPCAGVCSKAAS